LRNERPKICGRADRFAEGPVAERNSAVVEIVAQIIKKDTKIAKIAIK